MSFFKHVDSCGTYYRRVWLKLDGETVTLMCKYGTMGSGKYKVVMEGKQLPIQGPYSVILFHTVKITKEGKREKVAQDLKLAFDCYRFEQPLATEWDQHTEEYQIGLYCGNGATFNGTFSVHLIRNKFICSTCDFSILDRIDSLKYAPCTVEEFDAAAIGQ